MVPTSPTARGASMTGNDFPGGFKRGDIVYRCKDIRTPVRHGYVTRLGYDTDGEPLVIVRWPHEGTVVEAPENIRISTA